jgi:ribosomal protein S18 acetylase RimI-like enzyme
MEFEIADARPEDVDEVLAVKDQGWREAYTHLFSPEFLAGLGDSAERTERWRRFLAGDTGGRFAIARSQGRVVGMAGGGPPQGDTPPAPEELYTVYVIAEAYGAGVGRALVERVIGDRPAFLWVLEDNPRAIAFYRKLGFEPDGSRQFLTLDGRAVPEIRMVR